MDELLQKYANIPERFRWAGAASAAVLLVGVHFVLVYSSQQLTLGELQRQWKKADAQRTEKRAYAENLSKYEARLVELQENLATARAMLPDTADVPQLLAQIGGKGQLAGLTIKRFEPKGEVEEDFYAELLFQMQVRGSYHEITTFIDSVGKLDRIVNVSGITMQQPKTENQKVVVESDFVLKTYRFLPESAKKTKKKKKRKKKGKKK